MEQEPPYPPRFQPDNSPEARARRMANHVFVLARVVETPSTRFILGAHNQVIGVRRIESQPPPARPPGMDDEDDDEIA